MKIVGVQLEQMGNIKIYNRILGQRITSRAHLSNAENVEPGQESTNVYAFSICMPDSRLTKFKKREVGSCYHLDKEFSTFKRVNGMKQFVVRFRWKFVWTIEKSSTIRF